MDYYAIAVLGPNVLAAAIIAWVAYRVLTGKKTEHRLAMGICFAFFSLTCLVLLVEKTVGDMALARAVVLLEYICESVVLVALLMFVLQYIGLGRYANRRNALLSALPAMVTIGLYVTNDLHHLFYNDVAIVPSHGFYMFDADYGPLFLIWAGYFLGVFLITALLMARALLETPSYRRGGLRTMTLAIGAMALTSVLYVLSPRDDPRIDILSIGFTIAALIVFFGERYSDFADLEIIRFREAIGGMDDAVIILGPSMEVVYANGPGRRLLEQNAEFFWERVKARGLRVPSGPNRWETAMVIDGEPRHFILSTSDILRQGKPIGMVMVFHDISNRKGLEEELRRANRSIRLLNEVLRHDLMNDMTALWGYMELLEATELNDRQRHLVGKLIERARSAEAQLSFAAEQERNLATTTAWHDMQAIITKVLGQVDMNGIRTESHLEGLQVLADPKLENVFHVLADNTVRHGRKATRAVVRAENTETGLEIIWEDDGVGVPTESKENIFSKGVGDNTGLGLYLAREILATTGFTISEEGEPGKGARFVIRVPSGWFTWRMHPS